MSWSDDTRCLYCDGKLPLFRKLAHGQFCSKAHQKKYWDEQQHLAVERLHQTHSDIKAYKPPESIESILGPLGSTEEADFSYLAGDATSILGSPEPLRAAARPPSPEWPLPEEVPTEGAPAMAGFMAQMVDPLRGGLSPFIATGSLEFQPVLRAEVPAWAALSPAGATLRLRAVAEYLWEWAFRFIEAPKREAAAHPAIEIAPAVQFPANVLSLRKPVTTSEVRPLFEQQFDIAGPVPQAGTVAIEVQEPAPLAATGNVLHATHRWTAPRAALDSCGQQFSIQEPTLQEPSPLAPQGIVMAAAAGAVYFTLPVMSARLRGPAFEVPSDYEPPLVEKLKALGAPLAQSQVIGMHSLDTQPDHGYTAAGRPEIGLSKRTITSGAVTQFAIAGLQQLVPGAPTAVSAVAAGDVRSIERYAPGETEHPVLEGVSIPALDLAPGKLQALEVGPSPLAHGKPNGDPQPAQLPALAAEHPEPKLIGAPLAPNPPLAMAGLPWNLEVSAAPLFDATPSRSLTPHVETMLPQDSGASILPVNLQPALEAPAPQADVVEGPLDIPVQAGHIPMPNVLRVSPASQLAKLPAGRGVIPEPVQGQQMLPALRMEAVPVEFGPAVPVIDLNTPGAVIEAEAAHRSGLAGVRDFWKQAPRDLKLLACALPIVIGLAFHSLPKVSISAPETPGLPSGFTQVLHTQFANLKQSVANRAAVALDEDFRGGIDHWVSRTGATAEWSFSGTGFVQPGPLALYEPSLKLTDYQMQFLGMIDEKSMSWVARAEDFENYYVIKLVVLKPGPLPTIGLTRYAVINGKPVDRVDRPVPISVRTDTIYRIRMDVHGSNFALEVQGQMVDSWSEPRLARGGVGFFTGHGEKSSIRWVQLTHQYDVLGRLCAYLAPYEF